MPFYCQHCGFSILRGARFCSKCGAAVAATPPIAPGPLVRPRFGRQIGGVCEALARAHGWDVTVVRILAVVGFFCSSGLVGIAYLAAWVGIPEEMPPMPGAYPPRV